MRRSNEHCRWGDGQGSQSAERIGGIRLQSYEAVVVLVITAIFSYLTTYANEASTEDQWNIMVVPSRQTVYSVNARAFFNQNCARCHSKDGRAQTPVARQRHVQDLSECGLEEDAIVEQILEGTHNKTNNFRMPPFKEKLTLAEIKSLVPLVRAFRPLPLPPVDSRSVGDKSVNPRLAGIINVDWRAMAVLESGRAPGRYFMLFENESHEGVKLIKIRPKRG